MKRALVLCVALMALVGSFAWAKVAIIESNTLKWDWVGNGDQNNGGNSTSAVTPSTQGGMPGWTWKGVLGDGWEYCAAYAVATPDAATLAKSQSAIGFSFKILGDGDKYAVQVMSSDVKNGGYFSYSFETVKDQTLTVVVPTGFFLKPSWSNEGPNKLDMSKATAFQFGTQRGGNPGPFEVKIWDIRFYTGNANDKVELTAAEKKENDKAIAEGAAAQAKLPVGGKLSGVKWDVADNFQYAKGYIVYYSDPRVFNGKQIQKGDTYTLKFTCTASRDMEAEMRIYLVDRVASNGHTELTKQVIVPGSQLKAGVPFSATITLVADKKATSANVKANLIGMETEGAGAKGTKGSGKEKPFTITFSEFEFTKN